MEKMTTPVADNANQSSKNTEQRKFLAKDASVFDEMMDFFTLLMVWKKMPTKVTIDLSIPSELLTGEMSYQMLAAFKAFNRHLQTLIPTVQIQPPSKIAGDKLILTINLGAQI